MKLLHTSDWHLGRTLFGRRRYHEFESFLNWLADTIEANGIDILVVAGDVFDTSLPSNRAQEMYYQFLCRVAAGVCRHIVIVGGNHDSPSFLDAPKALLKALDIHVVAGSAPNPEDDVLVLRDQQGRPELIVCAVPYLRDRDIRVAEAGESLEDKERKLLQGIRAHYATLADLAVSTQKDLGGQIPIVATGHLFTAGGQTVEGDGVRELYVGSVAHVASSIFPPCFDYVALGHLHVPQMVGGTPRIRYSGSPLPMGFGEATQQKVVCQVTFQPLKGGTEPLIHEIHIPVFQRLERISGDWPVIQARVQQLAHHGADVQSSVWLEVVYEGKELMPDLRERLEALLSPQSKLEILRIKNKRHLNPSLNEQYDEESLEELSVNEVFERCLIAHEVPEEQRQTLRRTYQEAMTSFYESDKQAH